jgi:hypothetical protein
LWCELPETYRQLIAGELSERLAEVVVTETRHLDPDRRRQVDAQLTATGISQLGFERQPAASARLRIRRIGRAIWNVAVPNASTAESGSGPHPTPWQC